MVPPVGDLQQLSQYARISSKAENQAVSESQFKHTSNVETEKKKEDPTNSNTTTKRIMDWAIYNIKGQHVQTPHIGVNIDKSA
jgi:hypothetical protein